MMTSFLLDDYMSNFDIVLICFMHLFYIDEIGSNKSSEALVGRVYVIDQNSHSCSPNDALIVSRNLSFKSS